MATHVHSLSARAFPRVVTVLSSADKVHTKSLLTAAFTRPGLRRLVEARGVSLTSTRSMANSSSTAISEFPARRQHRDASAYRDAVVTLNSLQSNAETIRKSLKNRSNSRKHNISQMISYLNRVGLNVDDINKLNVIHVTGTKGKGSTCAFTESIIRQYGYKTGLYSSPHLIEARERIRINGRPIDRELFSTSFWEVYNRLQATKESDDDMPHYFSFLTVMAFYVFVRDAVDVVVLEVGIGGEYDSTNIVSAPVACGVSSLDFDHTKLLGHTLEDIAWHKAGIFKRGVPAITVPHPDNVMQVMLDRARDIQCPLYIASPLELDEISSKWAVHLGIAGHRQMWNAALAVQLCQVWLAARHTGCPMEFQPCAATVQNVPVKCSTTLSHQMITGLGECQWPGRTQTVQAEGVTYYLDGAHTSDSIQHCVEWFREAADKEQKELQGEVYRALVFNMTGDRPVATLLNTLKDCDFDRAAFCPNIVSSLGNTPDQLNLMVELSSAIKKSISYRRTWNKFVADKVSQKSMQNMLSRMSGSGTTHDEPDDSHLEDATCAELVNGSLEDKSQYKCMSANFPCITSALCWATQKDSVVAAQPRDPAAASCLKKEKSHPCHVQVLVTGSLHLVGGVLQLILPNMND